MFAATMALYLAIASVFTWDFVQDAMNDPGVFLDVEERIHAERFRLGMGAYAAFLGFAVDFSAFLSLLVVRARFKS